MSGRFELRIADSLFAELDAELRAGPRDSLESERAGFLLCGVARLTDRSALLARAWRPIPVESRVTEPGYGLAWNAEFNAVILDEADALHAVPVLVHRHASGRDARLSRRDRRMGDPLIASMSRLARGRLAASVVLDDSTAAGILWRSGTAEAALGEANVDRIPPRPDGKHVASDLLSFFFYGSDGQDFLYGAAIRRDRCRGLGNSGERPAPLR